MPCIARSFFATVWLSCLFLVPCSRLSWPYASFWVHIKYILSYHIVLKGMVERRLSQLIAPKIFCMGYCLLRMLLNFLLTRYLSGATICHIKSSGGHVISSHLILTYSECAKMRKTAKDIKNDEVYISRVKRMKKIDWKFLPSGRWSKMVWIYRCISGVGKIPLVSACILHEEWTYAII